MTEILDEEYVINKRNKRRNTFYVFFAFLILGSLIAAMLSWYNLKSIVYSGLSMSIIGIIFSLIAKKEKNRVGKILGLIPLASIIFWLVVINLFDLSPVDCEVIIPVFLSIASLVILVNGVYMLSSNYLDH